MTTMDSVTTTVTNPDVMPRQAPGELSGAVGDNGSAMNRQEQTSSEDVVNLSYRLESGDVSEERRKHSVPVTADERQALLEDGPRDGKISIYG